MSNTIYVSCLECDRLMQGEDWNLQCPGCNKHVCMDDGTDFADCGFLKTDTRHGKNICDCEFSEE